MTSYTPEPFVRKVLSCLERDFREQVLLALADWECSGLVVEHNIEVQRRLIRAVAELQAPTWGRWNGLLIALRKALAIAVEQNNPEDVERLRKVSRLNHLIKWYDSRLDTEVAESIKPLANIIRRSNFKRPTWGQVMELAITLRNRIAHDGTTDDVWWKNVAKALKPPFEHIGKFQRAFLQDVQEWPSPWFTFQGNERRSFNGLEKSSAPRFVNHRGVPVECPHLAGEIQSSIRRLFGAEEGSEDLTKLLEKYAPEDIDGVLLGDYVLTSHLDSGGFAKVYRGRQITTERHVAVKVLHDGRSDEDQWRFRQEAKYLAKFDHPHIVRVIDRGEGPWFPPQFKGTTRKEWYREWENSAPLKLYLVLEWIDGQTLESFFRDRQARETLTAVEVLKIAKMFEEVSRALAAVHLEKLLHRDIKPGNVMLTRDGNVKLMDFGVAKSASNATTLRTEAGTLVGTLAYMSPEQLLSENARDQLGPTSDVYMLCATFFELFSGMRLFEHDQIESENLRKRKLSGGLPSFSTQAAKSLPWEIQTIVLGGLHSDPSDRYQTALELADDLRRFLLDQPIKFRSPGFLRRAELFCRRNRGIVHLSATFFCVAIVGAIVSFFLWRAESSRASEAVVQQIAAQTESRKQKILVAEKTELAAEHLVEAGKQRVQRIEREYSEDLQEAWDHWSKNDLDAADRLLKKYGQLSSTLDVDSPVGFEWFYLESLMNGIREAAPAPLETSEDLHKEGSESVESAQGANRSLGNGNIPFWNLDHKNGSLFCVRFSPDNKFVIGFGTDFSKNHQGGYTLKKWSLPFGKMEASRAIPGFSLSRLPGEFVRADMLRPGDVSHIVPGSQQLAVSPDGHFCALTFKSVRKGEPTDPNVPSSSQDISKKLYHTGTVKVWNCETLEEIFSIDDALLSGNVVLFSPDGTHLIAGGYGGRICDWKTSEFGKYRLIQASESARPLRSVVGGVERILSNPTLGTPIYRLIFLDDGGMIASPEFGSASWPSGQRVDLRSREMDIPISMSPNGKWSVQERGEGTVDLVRSDSMNSPGSEDQDLRGQVQPHEGGQGFGSGSGAGFGGFQGAIKERFGGGGAQFNGGRIGFSGPPSSADPLSPQSFVNQNQPQRGGIRISEGAIECLAISDKYLAIAGPRGSMFLSKYDSETGELEPHNLLRGHRGNISCVTFDREGKTLAACGDNQVTFWNIEHDGVISQDEIDSSESKPEDSSHLHSPSHAVLLRNVSLSGNGPAEDQNVFRVQVDDLMHGCRYYPGEVRVGNRAGGASPNLNRCTVDVDPSLVRCAVVDDPTPADPLVGKSKQLPPSIRVSDMKSGEELHKLEGHRGLIRSLSFHPDGIKLLSESVDKKITIWDTHAGKEMTSLSEAGGCVGFSVDGESVIIVGTPGIAIWNYGKDSQPDVLSAIGTGMGLGNWAQSQDGTTLAVWGSAQNEIEIWDLPTRSRVKTIPFFESRPNELVIDSTKKTLILGNGNTVEFWSIGSGQQIASVSSFFPPHIARRNAAEDNEISNSRSQIHSVASTVRRWEMFWQSNDHDR